MFVRPKLTELHCWNPSSWLVLVCYPARPGLICLSFCQSMWVCKVTFNCSAENSTGPTDSVNKSLKIVNWCELWVRYFNDSCKNQELHCYKSERSYFVVSEVGVIWHKTQQEMTNRSYVTQNTTIWKFIWRGEILSGSWVPPAQAPASVLLAVSYPPVYGEINCTNNVTRSILVAQTCPQ